jgi:hypothetical protein
VDVRYHNMVTTSGIPLNYVCVHDGV